MPVVFRTDDTTKWGSGQGRVLHPTEVDQNFWELLQRIEALETSPPVPVSISSISYDAGTITINLNDGSHYGPFTIPTTMPRWRGEWFNATSYQYFDLVSVLRTGVFLVLKDHTSPALPATFDPNAEDGSGNKLYLQLTGALSDVAYDLAANVTGPIPSDGLPIVSYVADRAVFLPATLVGSQAYLVVAASTDDLVLPIEHNGTNVGSITFTHGVGVDANGGQPGVFAFAADVTLAAGDTLVIKAPTVDDPAAKDLAITLSGRRADL
jgi:hypothetical protein